MYVDKLNLTHMFGMVCFFKTQTVKVQSMSKYSAGYQNVSVVAWESYLKGAVMREGIEYFSNKGLLPLAEKALLVKLHN